tara:strand:- start:2037 stop:2345 length:309 start_codon:yes stop_codon:yes gene_type:complete
MEKLSGYPKASSEGWDLKDPVRSLWRNVLIVALEDAMGKGVNGGSVWANKNYYSHQSKESARNYFLEPSRDFQMVCQLAGFDYLYVRKKVREKIDEGTTDLS